MLIADPVMLATARQARGLTQAELARRTGRSGQAFISKAEAGQVELDGDRLSRTADMLRYPVSLLCMTAQEHSLVSACAFHRKRSSLPVSKIRRCTRAWTWPACRQRNCCAISRRRRYGFGASGRALTG